MKAGKFRPAPKVWLAASVSLLVLILVAQNFKAVTVTVFFWQLRTPLFLLVPFIFLLGMIAGYALRRKR